MKQRICEVEFWVTAIAKRRNADRPAKAFVLLNSILFFKAQEIQVMNSMMALTLGKITAAVKVELMCNFAIAPSSESTTN